MALSPRLALMMLLFATVLLALQLGTTGELEPFESSPVFRTGESNYTCYRIPALARMPTGEIALYAEARKDSCGDGGHIDLVYRISADNGTSWGPMRHLYGESTPETPVTIGNPAPVVVGGKVLLTFCRDNHQVLTLTSNDAGGRDWPSTPTDITEQIFGEPWLHWVATGPPAGLLTSRGRVLVPFNHGGSAGTLISDDDGVTWSKSNTIPLGNEGQVAESPDGTLLLNMRANPFGDNYRLLSPSKDGGTTWAHPIKLTGTGSECEGSMVSVRRSSDGAAGFVFSHNNGPRGRYNLTLWWSADGGSWAKVRDLDPTHPSAYSALLAHNSTHVAVAYERGDAEIRFGFASII